MGKYNRYRGGGKEGGGQLPSHPPPPRSHALQRLLYPSPKQWLKARLMVLLTGNWGGAGWGGGKFNRERGGGGGGMGPSAIPPLPPIPVAMHNCGYFTLPPMTKGRDCSRNRGGGGGGGRTTDSGEERGGCPSPSPPPTFHPVQYSTLLLLFYPSPID